MIRTSWSSGPAVVPSGRIVQSRMNLLLVDVSTPGPRRSSGIDSESTGVANDQTAAVVGVRYHSLNCARIVADSTNTRTDDHVVQRRVFARI